MPQKNILRTGQKYPKLFKQHGPHIMHFPSPTETIALKICNLFSLPLLHITKETAYFNTKVPLIFYPLNFTLGSLE